MILAFILIWVACGAVPGALYYRDKMRWLDEHEANGPEHFAGYIGAVFGLIISIALGPVSIFLRMLP